MTGEERARREPVWIASSALFLDTDPRMSYVSIVRELAGSGYSLDELWRILEDEVTPALQSNLVQAVGEWAMFPREWVIEQVLPQAGKRRWLPSLVGVERDWRVLEALIRIIRLLPDEESRSRRLSVWQALMPLLLIQRCTPFPDHCAGLEIGEVERTFRSELMRLFPPGASGLSTDEVESNWRRFAAAMASGRTST